ncbi:MAG: coenzyme F420-0:L-glutamate ligase [Firmicutes bacterium]|nr:coenzyme F420-0:L-glutamate ligase [Bacillota bacterium]
MSNHELTIFAVTGIQDIVPGDNLAEIITSRVQLQDYDVLIITQKIISKAEGRVVKLADVDQSDKARSSDDIKESTDQLPSGPSGDDFMAAAKEKLVMSESRAILRRRGSLIISETKHGFICANAGVDLSNVESGYAVLLPIDPDYSARRIRSQICHKLGIEIGVIITDTFGRPWRQGLTDVAIGVAGIGAIEDLRNSKDAYGNDLHATQVCVADEMAGAANLVLGKSSKLPVAVIRGVDKGLFRQSSVREEIIRPASEDLFR